MRLACMTLLDLPVYGSADLDTIFKEHVAVTANSLGCIPKT